MNDHLLKYQGELTEIKTRLRSLEVRNQALKNILQRAGEEIEKQRFIDDCLCFHFDDSSNMV